MISGEEQRKLDKELLRECRGYSERDNKPDGAYIKHGSMFFNLNKIKRLIEAGADVNAKDGWGDLLLASAVWRNSVELTKCLISASANVNVEDKHGCMLLHRAVLRNNVAIAKCLISAGASVNAKDKHGHSPLHYTRSYEITKLLISVGADVNSKTKSGTTPLHVAVRRGYKKIQDLLKQHGAV